MTASSLTVQSAYRRVLRAAKIAFVQDANALQQARIKVRNEFQKPLEGKLERRLKTADDVAMILTRQVVQADIVPMTQAARVQEQQQKEGVLLKLKLDPTRHEMGDNSSRFNPTPKRGSARVTKCCSA